MQLSSIRVAVKIVAPLSVRGDREGRGYRYYSKFFHLLSPYLENQDMHLHIHYSCKCTRLSSAASVFGRTLWCVVTSWYARATAMLTLSRKEGEIICPPSGEPSSNPIGNATVGHPSKLAGPPSPPMFRHVSENGRSAGGARW